VSWDNKSGKENQPPSAKKQWDKLTHIERAAAVALGYTGSMWDKGGKKHQPASASKYWAELTSCGDNFARLRSIFTENMSNKGEQAAARVLGFTRTSWDNVSGQEKQPLSTFKKWAQLTVRERVAANVLGYSEDTWNRVDKQEQPVWMTKRWDDLAFHDRETTKKPAPQTSARATHTTRTTTHLRGSADISYAQDSSAVGVVSGSVVGILIGVVAVVGAIAAVLLFSIKRKNSRGQVKSESPDKAVITRDESKAPDTKNELQGEEMTE